MYGILDSPQNATGVPRKINIHEFKIQFPKSDWHQLVAHWSPVIGNARPKILPFYVNVCMLGATVQLFISDKDAR